MPATRPSTPLIRAALLASATLAAGCAYATAVADTATGGEKYALVVGVSDYPGTLLDLPLVAADVRAVTAMLTGTLGFAPENLRVLESEQATRGAILDGITGFLGQAGANDVALFYYSGHGTRLKDNVAVTGPADPESDDRDEALVAHDQLLVDDEISHALNSIGAGRVLVLFDSCHSGDATRADLSRGMPKSADIGEVSKYIDLPEDFRIPPLQAGAGGAGSAPLLDTTREGRLFIAASAEDELSWVAPNLGLSLFTYFLTERAAQSADLSFEALVGEISPRVNQFARQYFQVPQSTHLEGSSATARMTLGEFFE